MDTTTGFPAALKPMISWCIASDATAHPPIETKYTHIKATPTNKEGIAPLQALTSLACSNRQDLAKR